MRQIFTIFAYTLRDAAKKKAFIVSTVIMALIIVILCCVPAFLNLVGANDGTEDTPPDAIERTQRCYYIDPDNLIPGGISALSASFLDTEFVAGEPESLKSYQDISADDGSVSVILLSRGESVPEITVYTKDFMSGISAADVTTVLSKLYTAQTMHNAGVSDEMIALASAEFPYTVETLGQMDISGYAIGIVVTLIMFYAIYFYGYSIASSVATEKTSRVMETLIVSAKPSRILIGKCLAMGALGLIQLAMLLVIGGASYNLLVPENFVLFGTPLNLSAFTLTSSLLILLYFVLGYALYAMMNSVCGAMVSRMEDLQAAISPTMMISLISFYIAYFTMLAGSTTDMISKITMYVPFTSPFVIPFKLLNGGVTTSDLLISVGILLISIGIVTFLSIKIYSASVLHYGERLKWKDLRRLDYKQAK